MEQENAIVQKAFYTENNTLIDTNRLRQSLTKHLGEAAIEHHNITIDQNQNADGVTKYNIAIISPQVEGRDTASVVDAAMNISLYENGVDKVARADDVSTNAQHHGWHTNYTSDAVDIQPKKIETQKEEPQNEVLEVLRQQLLQAQQPAVAR